MNLEKLFYRVILGYYYIEVNNIRYKIKYPSLEIKYEAEEIYEKTIEDNKFDKRWLTEDEINLFLKINNIWLPSNNDDIKNLEKFIEDTKIDMYVNYGSEIKRKQLKKQLRDATKQLNSLHSKKNSFAYLGIIDHATGIKNEFMLIHSIYDLYNNLIFNNCVQDNYDHNKLQLFIREIVEHAITANDLRALAKSELWKSFAASANLTREIDLVNDDYRHLINLHRMYENVRQHPECPSNEILEDDDALDGWFLYQNRKAEKEKKKNAILEKVGGNKKKDYGEVFVVTQDKEQTSEIYSLNEQSTMMEIKEMVNATKTKGTLQWSEVPHIQRQLKQQQTEGIKAKTKGNG